MQVFLRMGIFVKFFLVATITSIIAFTLIAQKSSPLPQIKDEWWGDDSVPQIEDASIRPFKIEIPAEVFMFQMFYHSISSPIQFATGH